MELLTSLENSAFSEWVRLSPSLWAYPGILTLHTVGLAILVGANTVVDLRVLGVGRGLRISKLPAFFPAMWLGFFINAASGVVLFAAYATTRIAQPIFLVKLGLIAAAVAVIVQLQRMIRAASAAESLPSRATMLAGASLVLWVAAIAAGRFMAYFNNTPPPSL